MVREEKKCNVVKKEYEKLEKAGVFYQAGYSSYRENL